MKAYAVKRRSAPVDWDLVESRPLTACRWSPNAPPAARMQAVHVPGQGLRFRLSCDAEPARAVNTAEDSPVYEDNCLECFFSFGGKCYVNLEVNVNGALLAFVGPDRKHREPLRKLGIPRPAVHSERCPDGWSVTLSIPDEAVEALYGLRPAPGTRFYANCYACGDKTPAPYYAALFPVDTPAPDFHRPEFFGLFTIE